MDFAMVSRSIVDRIRAKDKITIICLSLLVISIIISILLRTVILVPVMIILTIILISKISPASSIEIDFANQSGRPPTREESTILTLYYFLCITLIIAFFFLNIRFPTSPLWIFIRMVVFLLALGLIYKYVLIRYLLNNHKKSGD